MHLLKGIYCDFPFARLCEFSNITVRELKPTHALYYSPNKIFIFFTEKIFWLMDLMKNQGWLFQIQDSKNNKNLTK